jgi:hypothetical protein
MDYGVVEVVDDYGSDLTGAVVSVSTPSKPLFREQGRSVRIYPDYTSPQTISVASEGFAKQSFSLPSPTNWPLHVVLRRTN